MNNSCTNTPSHPLIIIILQFHCKDRKKSQQSVVKWVSDSSKSSHRDKFKFGAKISISQSVYLLLNRLLVPYPVTCGNGPSICIKNAYQK